MRDRSTGPAEVRPNTLSDQRAPNTLGGMAGQGSAGVRDPRIADHASAPAPSHGLPLPNVRPWVWVAAVGLVLLVARFVLHVI